MLVLNLMLIGLAVALDPLPLSAGERSEQRGLDLKLFVITVRDVRPCSARRRPG